MASCLRHQIHGTVGGLSNTQLQSLLIASSWRSVCWRATLVTTPPPLRPRTPQEVEIAFEQVGCEPNFSAEQILRLGKRGEIDRRRLYVPWLSAPRFAASKINQGSQLCRLNDKNAFAVDSESVRVLARGARVNFGAHKVRVRGIERAFYFPPLVKTRAYFRIVLMVDDWRQEGVHLLELLPLAQQDGQH